MSVRISTRVLRERISMLIRLIPSRRMLEAQGRRGVCLRICVIPKRKMGGQALVHRCHPRPALRHQDFSPSANPIVLKTFPTRSSYWTLFSWTLRMAHSTWIALHSSPRRCHAFNNSPHFHSLSLSQTLLRSPFHHYHSLLSPHFRRHPLLLQLLCSQQRT